LNLQDPVLVLGFPISIFENTKGDLPASNNPFGNSKNYFQKSS